MKKNYNTKITFTAFFMVLIFTSTLTAQVSTGYNFAQANSSYSSITGGTAIWTSTFDDNVSSAITIPSFNFNCTAYTRIYVSSNGFITFGSAPTAANYTPLSGSESYSGAIAAFGRDLNNATSGSPEVRYQQVGTEFVVQWKDARRYNVVGERISFQIRLDSSTNTIKVVYGGTISPGSNTTYPQVGLRGSSNADYNNRNAINTTGAWINSTAGGSNAATCYYNSATPATVPAVGATFTWSQKSMTFTSSTCAQPVVSSVSKCGYDQQVINIQIVTGGGCNTPLSLSQIRMNMTGCTSALTDVTKIHIYYTGTSSTFSASGEFLVGGISPAAGTITINGTQSLLSGTNYFWIVYDLNTAATTGNVIDAQCTQITVTGTNYVPSTTSPAGTRSIIACIPYPGGVSTGLTAWYKQTAANITITSGKVSAWNDEIAAFSISQGTAGKRPIQVAGSTNYTWFNYNQRLKFDKAAQTSLFNTSVVSDLLGTNGVFFLIGDHDNTGSTAYQYYANTNYRYQLKPGFRCQTGVSPTGYTFDWSAPSEYPVQAAAMMVSSGCGPTAAFRLNSTLYSIPNNVAPLYFPSIGSGLSIGGNIALAEWGDNAISEVLMFNASLSTTQFNKIESYLAIKWGITRGGNSSPKTYIASDGTTIWDATANSGYSNDIAGIGRDDASGLYQKQSISVNNNELITMGVTNIATDNVANANTIANDKSFIVWGNNGQTPYADYTLTDLPATVQGRIKRVWKAQQTNFNQALTIGFEKSLLVNYNPVSNLRLIIDDNGNFSNATVISGAVINGNRVEFSGINLTSLNLFYFTLATANSAATPLPVQLISFTAKCNENKVDIKWATASENNNDYFSLLRSENGLHFDKVATIKGAGNSSNYNSYTWTDQDPIAGNSYYRIKQTDYNGQSKTLDQRIVNCYNDNESFMDLSLYPNPFKNEFNVSFKGKLNPGTVLKVLNSVGQTVLQKELITGSNKLNIILENNLPKGIYLLMLVDESGIIGKKLIKKV